MMLGWVGVKIGVRDCWIIPANKPSVRSSKALEKGGPELLRPGPSRDSSPPLSPLCAPGGEGPDHRLVARESRILIKRPATQVLSSGGDGDLVLLAGCQRPRSVRRVGVDH